MLGAPREQRLYPYLITELLEKYWKFFSSGNRKHSPQRTLGREIHNRVEP